MGKAVLLLHGWLSDINDFACLLPYLDKSYEYVERFVHPGHEENGDHLEFRTQSTFQKLESTFESLLTNYDRVDVIGYSMGGALATYLATKYDFGKLVLLAPANKYFNLYLPFSKAKYAIKLLYEIQKALLLRNQEDYEQTKAKIALILKDDLQSLKLAKARYLKSYFRHAYREFKLIIEKVNENANNIPNPCFIAWGKLDQLVPKEAVEYIYNLCTNKNKKFKIYEDLSHLLLLSPNCEELVQDIEEFLEEEEIVIERNFN